MTLVRNRNFDISNVLNSTIFPFRDKVLLFHILNCSSKFFIIFSKFAFSASVVLCPTYIPNIRIILSGPDMSNDLAVQYFYFPIINLEF